MAAPLRSLPALMEELVEEILLRFPPHEPARLIHAALVCKRWARLISGPSFRCRFRELHRAPPMLGLLCNGLGGPYGGADSCRFVPTAAFRPPSQAEHSFWRAVDSRHGRVLLRHREVFKNGGLVVWDPITDEKRKLPILPRHTSTWNAAVLCSPGAGACDHLDCHRGPFLVILVSSHTEEIFIYTYSSSADMWSGPISTPHPNPDGDCIHPLMPNALVGNALYFGFLTKTRALKYDLDLQEISFIGLPPKYSGWRRAVLTATEGGGLGFVTVHESKLCVWSRKAGLEVDDGWIQNRAIDLEMLLSDDAILMSPCVVGSVDGVGVIFLRSNGVIYTIDLKTNKVKKVCEGRAIISVVPYMSFYTPGI